MCLPEDAVTDQWRVGIGDELWIWILGLASVKLEMVIRPCRRSRFLGVQEPQLQGGTTEWTRGHLKDKMDLCLDCVQTEGKSAQGKEYRISHMG
jgi:hypothetical protein